MVREKYFARMMGRDGLVRRLSIGQEGYTGIAKELTLVDSGLTISENDGEGISSYIRSWSGYASIFDEGQTEELFARNGHDMPVSIGIEGGKSEWNGFISPAVRTQIYPSDNTVLEMPLRGRLSTASGYNIKEDLGMSTLGGLLYESLILSGYTDECICYWPNTFGVSSSSNGLSILAIEVSRSLFITGKKERTTVRKGDALDNPITSTAADVLSEIAKVFGFTWYERGESVIAISNNESSYFGIPIGTLKTLSSASDFTALGSNILSSKLLEISQLEGEGHNYSKINGNHSVTVSMKLQKVNGNLFDFNLEDFAYVDSYKRPLDYSNPSQGYKFLFTQVFERTNFKDIETYIYYRMSAGTEEDWQKGWYPWDSVKLANWHYGYRQGKESKPGCFPARISISEENPYYDPQHKPGSQPNQWLVGHSFTDGFIFNPAYYENGEYGFIGNKYPLIKFHNKKSGIYSRGTFALNFNVGAFPVCKADQNSPNPVTPFCRFSISLRVGEYKYKVINHHSASGSWNEWGWVKTDEAPSQIAVHTIVDSENSFPTSLVVKDNRGSGRYPNRAMPNVKGMTFPIWDTEGNEIVLTGDIEFTLYADPNDKMTGDNKQTKPRLVFISDVNFEFISEDQYPEGYVPSSKDKERTLHKLTEMGFEDGDESVNISMGSFAADNSSSLSAMTYNGQGLEKIYRFSDGVEKAPEEFLLDHLFDYNNRVAERRIIYIAHDKPEMTPFPSDKIRIGARTWRIVAISENYGEGQIKLTLEDQNT